MCNSLFQQWTATQYGPKKLRKKVKKTIKKCFTGQSCEWYFTKEELQQT